MRPMIVAFTSIFAILAIGFVAAPLDQPAICENPSFRTSVIERVMLDDVSRLHMSLTRLSTCGAFISSELANSAVVQDNKRLAMELEELRQRFERLPKKL